MCVCVLLIFARELVDFIRRPKCNRSSLIIFELTPPRRRRSRNTVDWNSLVENEAIMKEKQDWLFLKPITDTRRHERK